MSAQVSTLLLILAALIGLFIGLLLSSLFSSKDGSQKNLPPREIQKEGYGEVARLWYSPAGKKILTEMDGGFYKSFDTLSVEQQAKVRRLLTFWKDWAGEVSTPEVTEKANPAVEEYYQPTVAETLKEQNEQYADIPAAAPVAPFQTEAQEEADVVSTLQQSLEFEEETAPDFMPPSPAEFSITQQINAILQDILATTDLADKGIRLEENMNHGVDVIVGDEKYPGIEDVPYPQLRTLIHEAVLRWEQESESQQRMGD